MAIEKITEFQATCKCGRKSLRYKGKIKLKARLRAAGWKIDGDECLCMRCRLRPEPNMRECPHCRTSQVAADYFKCSNCGAIVQCV